MGNSIENRILSVVIRLAMPLIVLFVIFSIMQISENKERDKKIEEYVSGFDYNVNSVKPTYFSFYLKNDSAQQIPQGKIIVFTCSKGRELHFGLELNKTLSQALIASKKSELKTIVVVNYAENDDVEVGYMDYKSGELIAKETLEHHSYRATYRNRRTGSYTTKDETYSAPFKDIVYSIEHRIQNVSEPSLQKMNATTNDSIGSNNTPFQIKKNRLNISMVFVQGGTFQMGSDNNNDDNPLRKVKLSSFYIGKYEITQKQWRDVMGNNPSYHNTCNDCPVESMTWDDVQQFLAKANEKFHEHYRLPTSAEWEFAARGGNKTKNCAFSGSSKLDAIAWYGNNSIGKSHRCETHTIGKKLPNELGIYDMSGNVWEWVSDWYEENNILGINHLDNDGLSTRFYNYYLSYIFPKQDTS